MFVRLFVLLFIVSVSIDCQEKEECVAEKLRECSLRHKIDSHYYPTTQTELENYCSAIRQHEDCTKNGWSQCIDGKKEREFIFKRLNEFSSFHYKDLCNTSTTYSRLFVKYGKCLNQTFAEQNECQMRYRVISLPKDNLLAAIGYSRNNSRTENTRKIRQICCWWSEYQSCTMRTVLDRCGDQAALLISEQFYKTHTKSSASRVLTYKSCIPPDKSFRFPACLLDRSVDPNTLRINFNFSEISIEDIGRRRDIQLAIGMNVNHTEVGPIEASVYNENNSAFIKSSLNQFVTAFLFLFIFYW